MVSVSFAASSILEQALEIFNSSDPQKASRIVEILVLCDFEHFTMKDQIGVNFFLQSSDSPAKGSRLVFERATNHLQCTFCEKIFPYPDTSNTGLKGFTTNCPRCGSGETQLISFDLMVKKVKVS